MNVFFFYFYFSLVHSSTSTERDSTCEDISMEKTVDVDMGKDNQYKQQATYKYGSERDTSTKYSTIESTSDVVVPTYVDQPETVIEHISEDEKSTSSEEAFFEEWSEEFRCRRTDEYDRGTNQLIRTTFDETSERIRSDVVKEEYKGKSTRVKRRKSYDIVRVADQTVPTSTRESADQIRARLYEESSYVSRTPLTIQTPTPSILPQDRLWSSEEIYTTEIVCDRNLAKDTSLQTQEFDVSSNDYGRMQSDRHTTIPSSVPTTTTTRHYDYASTVMTPTINYADISKKEAEEETVSEEYQVEFEIPKTDTTEISNQRYTGRRSSDWRDRLKQIYAPTSDDNKYDQVKIEFFLFLSFFLLFFVDSIKYLSEIIPYSHIV